MPPRKTLGMKIARVWVSTKDGRTRDSHKAMDGQEADKDGFFHFPGGGQTAGPGLSGIAEEDIHCRCTVIMQIKKL